MYSDITVDQHCFRPHLPKCETVTHIGYWAFEEWVGPHEEG